MDYISRVMMIFNPLMVDGSSGYEETSFNKQFNKLSLKLSRDLEILKDDSGEDLSEHFKKLEELKKHQRYPLLILRT